VAPNPKSPKTPTSARSLRRAGATKSLFDFGIDDDEPVVERPPLLVDDTIEITVYTKQLKTLCSIRAYRGWKLSDLKDGIWTETSIAPIEQKIYVNNEEMPKNVLFQDLFPAAVAGAAVTLTRRSPEQSVWLKKCMEYGLQLQYAPKDMQNDLEVVLAAVKRNPKAIQFASPALRNQTQVLLAALTQDVDTADFLDPSVWSKREFVLEAVRIDWQLLRMACEELQRDPEVVLAAIRGPKGHWDAISAGSPEVWEHIEVPRAAAETGGWTVHDIAPHELQAGLRKDKQFALSCVRLDWRNLEKIDVHLLNDLDIALAAVSQDWRALQWLHEDLRSDEEVIRTVVQHNFLCLTLALEEFPIEQPVVLQIIRQNWELYAHIKEELRIDPQLSLAAISQCWRALDFAPEARKADPDVVTVACKQNCEAILLASPSMLAHKGVMSIVLQEDAMKLQLAADNVRDDEKVLDAVNRDWRCLQYASDRVRSIPDVVFPALMHDLCVMDWASTALRSDSAAMLKFIRHRKDVFPFVTDSLIADPEFVHTVGSDKKLGRKFVMGILQRNWRSLEHVPEFMKRDPEIILTAAKVDWHAIEMVEDFYDCWYHPKIALAAVEQDYKNIRNLNSSMWEDLAIVVAAVQQNYNILEEAPDFLVRRLWSEEDVVRAAVAQDPSVMKKAAKPLWAEKELVLEACRGDWTIMEKCPKELVRAYWKDKDFAMAAVAQSIDAMKKLPDSFWEEKDIMRVAAKTDCKVIYKCSAYNQKSLLEDREIVLTCVAQNGLMLKDADESLQYDMEIVKAAVKENWTVMDKVSKYYQNVYWNDEECARVALFLGSTSAEADLSSLEKVGPKLQQKKAFIFDFVRARGQLLELAREFWDDADIVQAAVAQDGMALQFASERLRADHGVVKVAAAQNPGALKFANEELLEHGMLKDAK